MKYLKSIYESKNLNDLYHILDYEKLLFVLNNNVIKSYKAGNGRISTTRDKMLNSYLGGSPQSIFKLVLDGKKLSEKYKIKPFRYFSKNGQSFQEYEEQIQSREIKNVFKYIKKVVLMKQRTKNLMTYPWSKTGEVSDYLTSIGASNGTLPDMIKTIKDKLDKLNIDFVVQDKTKIEFNDEFINYIINYPIKKVKTKNIIMYRGGIQGEREFSYKDSAVDLNGEVVTDNLVVGNMINYEDKKYIEINGDNKKELKNKYKPTNFSIYKRKFKPYVFSIRQLDNKKWKLDDMRPLEWF